MCVHVWPVERSCKTDETPWGAVWRDAGDWRRLDQRTRRWHLSNARVVPAEPCPPGKPFRIRQGRPVVATRFVVSRIFPAFCDHALRENIKSRRERPVQTEERNPRGRANGSIRLKAPAPIRSWRAHKSLDLNPADSSKSFVNRLSKNAPPYLVL